mmetsp:Transcript_14348/g.10074  ORF Transcript_14348/g.10074 Transcript_14348/m.10074 type:complete len:86 (+) Transcript_14348:785-1042(+)
MYLISLVFCIWAASIKKDYIYTIIGLSLELVALLYLVCSQFPGGKQGFKYMLAFVWAGIKKLFLCCVSCCDPTSSSSSSSTGRAN